MTDHVAIAARVRQDRRAGTLFSGPVYIKLADMADAYLDLYDEAQRLRAERDRLRAQCCMCGKTGLSTIEDGGPECELDDGRWVCSVDCYDRAVLNPLEAEAEREHLTHMLDLSKKTIEAVLERAQNAEAERDRLRAALDDALVACRIVDAVARAGHEKIGDLVLHMLSAVEPARAALKGTSE